MPATRSYADERRIYPEAYAMYYTDEETRFIIKKLCRRYGLTYHWIRITFTNRHGACGGRNIMRFPHDPSIAFTLHEFVHCGMFSGWNVGKSERGHGIVFEGCVRLLHDYARTRGYWKDEIATRRATQAAAKRRQAERRQAREAAAAPARAAAAIVKAESDKVNSDPVVIRQKKIDAHESAIKKMKTRVKRIETAMKKRRLSISRLKVYQRKAKEGPKS